MSRAVRLALGAVVGALFASAAGPDVTFVVGLGALGLALTATPVRRLVALAPRRAVPLAAGILVIGLRAAAIGPPAIVHDLPGGSGPWRGTVESVSSPKAGSRPAVVALDEPAGLVVAATLPWFPEVAAGDRIEIDGRLEAPPAGDYGAYLRRIGASATVRASGLRLAAAPGSDPGPWEALRRASARALDLAMPAPESGLAAGILVGLRDRVDRDLAAAFTTAGVSHIVAISGWNIAIVATTLGALTGRLGRRRRTVATCLAIAAYVGFVGPSPSVVRAAAMAACALLAREVGRPTTATAAMGLAVFGLLLLDPAYVDDPGFRLSVLATAGLMAWGTPLAARLAGGSPGRLRAWLAESLGVSLAAQAATLPVILLDFGRLSVVSPVVNVLVAPIVAPAMAAGGLALATGLAVQVGAPAAIATIAGLPAWFLLGVLIGVVRAAAGLPFASVGLDPPANALAAGAAAIGLAAVVSAARHRRSAPDTQPPQERASSRSQAGAGRRFRGVVALLLGASTAAVAIAAIHRPDGATRITVLDVGQGDAILIEGGRGGRLLVDGGPDPTRLLIALGERLPPWDRRLDAVILTHPHEDHVAGLAALLSRYRVGRVFEPGMIGPGPGYAAWATKLSGGGPSRWSLATGDRLAVDDVELRVLWPDPGTVPLHPADSGTSINNVSIVLLGQVAGHAFLLAGDMEQAIDPRLLAEGLPHLDFLKVAHHGSGTASTQAFLDAVQPKVAAVSVGAGNPYGHPAPATIARLRSVARQVYRTDLDGSVTVTFDGSAERVHASGGRPTARAREAASDSPGGTTARSSFACSIPTGTALPVALATAPGRPSSAGGAAPPRATNLGRERRTGGYHRPDDGPVPSGGGPLAPLPPSPGLAPAALARRRRGRRVDRAADRRAKPAEHDRSRPRRGGRPPP
jgi:competence protein ComEC